jgi:hypothetical protein
MFELTIKRYRNVWFRLQRQALFYQQIQVGGMSQLMYDIDVYMLWRKAQGFYPQIHLDDFCRMFEDALDETGV